MRSNYALRTLLLLTAWLVLQNFNLGHKVAGHAAKTETNAFHQGKSMETLPDLPYLATNKLIPPAGAFTSNSPSEGKKAKACNHLSAVQPHAPSPKPSTVHRQPSTVHRQPSTADNYKIKTIVLDAGHGGKDSGCAGPTSKEKDNALAIVLHLGALLEANFPDINIIYTRKTDVFVELNERAAIANRNAADLFICVHCNAMSVSHVHGAETYVLGLHKVGDNLEVAKRENSSIYLEDNYQKNYGDYDPNSTEAHIFGSSWQSAYLEQSILLAQYVQQFAKSEAFREDRGVRQAGFLVLKETAMPAVLIETGYLTNASEDAFLASPEGQEQTAMGIFKAIRAYKNHMERGQSSVAATNKAPVKSVARSIPVNAGAREVPSKSQEPTAVKKPAANTASTFKIFLLSWPNRLDPNSGQMSLLSNVKEELKDGKYHYYVGSYTTRAEAEKVLPEIKNLGFKTANIVQ
jgi:N-acetylmuramoyl-L-alanine amidase